MINVFQPALGAEELEAVRKVFESNWIGKGKLTEQFETEFARHLGTGRELVRTASCCTEGLFQSMTLLGIGPGDEVVLPTIGFVGAANAIAASGARLVFGDVDKRTLNATAALLDEKITPRTKAVMILHYGGVSCEMEAIGELVRRKGIALIEDSACSVASRYRGKACGTFGDLAAWSFDAMKILVTGDGGMVWCRSPELAQRAEEQLYLGLLSKSGFSGGVDKKWWQFEISCFGRRAIMNDVACAIGLEQLKKLPRFIARRKEVHERYNRGFASVGWLQTPPEAAPGDESSYYFYWIQTPARVRDPLAIHLREKGIYSTFRYYPLHWVRHYGADVRLPGAEEAAETTLCLPLHQSLSDVDVDRVIEAVTQFRMP